jgi:hypothetical protein
MTAKAISEIMAAKNAKVADKRKLKPEVKQKCSAPDCEKLGRSEFNGFCTTCFQDINANRTMTAEAISEIMAANNDNKAHKRKLKPKCSACGIIEQLQGTFGDMCSSCFSDPTVNKLRTAEEIDHIRQDYLKRHRSKDSYHCQEENCDKVSAVSRKNGGNWCTSCFREKNHNAWVDWRMSINNKLRKRYANDWAYRMIVGQRFCWRMSMKSTKNGTSFKKRKTTKCYLGIADQRQLGLFIEAQLEYFGYNWKMLTC